MVVTVLLLLVACVDDPWPVGTQMHTDASELGESRQVTWHGQVRVAIDSWKLRLGEDCPFPFELLDGPAEDSRAIELFPADNWNAQCGEADNALACWYGDAGIEVLEDSNPNRLIYSVMHELGHAMSGGWHSDDRRDLMSEKGSSIVTDRDIARMRSALGCE